MSNMAVRDYDSETLTNWLKLNGMPEEVYSVIKGNFIYILHISVLLKVD